MGERGRFAPVGWRREKVTHRENSKPLHSAEVVSILVLQEYNEPGNPITYKALPTYNKDRTLSALENTKHNYTHVIAVIPYNNFETAKRDTPKLQERLDTLGVIESVLPEHLTLYELPFDKAKIPLPICLTLQETLVLTRILGELKFTRIERITIDLILNKLRESIT